MTDRHLTSEKVTEVTDEWIASNLDWYKTASRDSQGGHIYRALLELRDRRASAKRIEEYGH